ncbi:dipeptide ABC transporter ATP-binding protein [Labrys monachus]|uniref:Peptide/nickel transport system ATP-binding protein n=1 Tax=Labrys monachus TaxID=217067 RepID=A0ABU0FEC2_9HYPH|nr:ABC transporter ATP-binding protein [Labrys monachus]MDQ0392960.1 peptide/nickel transport system ATP-binding protein [Labrys monachus]
MTSVLVDIQGLTVAYPTGDGLLHALRGVSLGIVPGEILGIVGESGCGKTTLAYTLLGDLGGNAEVAGTALFGGRDILRMDEAELRTMRGRHVAMVPQNPGEALNPARRVGEQLREVLAVHASLSGRDATARIVALLEKVHLPDPEGIMRRWPHELSGGQQQRLVIAMALLGGPELLVLDEPTTGLDVTVEAAVLDLLAELRRDLGVTIVLISHNLLTIARACDRVVVMYAGLVAETGPAAAIFAQPRHPYTRALLDCIPRIDRPRGAAEPAPIPGSLPSPFEALAGCSFANRCPYAMPACIQAPPPLLRVSDRHAAACIRWPEIPREPSAAEATASPALAVDGGEVLRVDKLGVTYHLRRAKGASGTLKAVDAVSLELGAGRITAIVGESGSGKSSLAGAIAGLRPADAGSIHLGGKSVPRLLRRRPGWTRRFLQMVFQDHTSTLNPELRAGRSIDRAVRLLDGTISSPVGDRTAALMRQVGLDPSTAFRRPAELSGGQRQRIAIARAFAGRPRLVICDEITSALDVSIQAQVIAFLRELQRANGTSLLFITHDLGVVRQIADEIVVMYLGTICERGPADAVFSGPNHPYTAALLETVAAEDPNAARRRTPLAGALPDPAERRIGCPFKTRCPRRLGPVCDTVEPPWRSAGDRHGIRCHIPAAELARNSVRASGPDSTARPDLRLGDAPGVVLQ